MVYAMVRPVKLSDLPDLMLRSLIDRDLKLIAVYRRRLQLILSGTRLSLDVIIDQARGRCVVSNDGVRPTSFFETAKLLRLLLFQAFGRGPRNEDESLLCR